MEQVLAVDGQVLKRTFSCAVLVLSAPVSPARSRPPGTSGDGSRLIHLALQAVQVPLEQTLGPAEMRCGHRRHRESRPGDPLLSPKPSHQ